ncbi:uncharacterized protein [Setaria viridis]|uniref:uncharacterized protein n=1 Tax=Setaria viridis TaxID=4556 RepID=UPI003B3A1CA8
MTLTMKSSVYTKWASFFKSMCGKFGLKSHIDGMVVPHPQDPDWDQADCCIHSWFFSSVDDSILDLAMTDDDQTTRDLWFTIEGLFRANKQSRTIFLSHDFHSMTHDDSSIAEYCSRMKTLANALHDISHPVQDSQLVLNLLRGLNPRFSNTANDIANSTAGFPSFALKELCLTNEEKISNSTALLDGNSASLSSSDCTGGCHPPFGSVQIGGGDSNSSGGRTSGGGGGGKKK